VKSISLYNLLHHYVKQATGTHFDCPLNGNKGKKRLLLLHSLAREMQTRGRMLGGCRIECRISATTPLDAQRILLLSKPWDIDNILDVSFIKHVVSVENYLIKLPALLHRAKTILLALGMRIGHRGTALTVPMKQVFGDLKMAFGVTNFRGHRTEDPIAPNVWWRQAMMPPVEEGIILEFYMSLITITTAISLFVL
jgi:hypothetical protein